MKKVLITGGIGFIGTNLTTRFIEAGYHVVAFDNHSREGVARNLEWLKATYKNQFTYVWGDVRNVEDWQELNEHEFVCCAHLGANPGIPRSLRNPDYDWRVNADGTKNMLEYVRHHGSPFVLYASTNKVYSDKINELPLHIQGQRYMPIDIEYQGNPETFPLDGQGSSYPSSPYGCSKAAGDRLVQEYSTTYKIPAAILRMSCIGGLHQLGVSEQGWISWFAYQATKGTRHLEIFGSGYQVRDILDGRDVAEVYFQLFQRGASDYNVFNLGGSLDNSASLNETIAFLEQETGQKFNLKYYDWRVADHKFYCSDTRRIRNLLGWAPKYTWQDTIRDMVQEYAS